MRRNSIDILFGDITPSNVDYKVSLNQEDEDAKRYDYLANKISSKNFNFDLCSRDKTLIYCEIDENNKIFLSPQNEEGEGGEESSETYDIIIDSYPLLDSNNVMELEQGMSSKTLVFPMQIATGKIRKISVLAAQNGGTLKGGYIAIYANDIPDVIGAKLVFDTNSTNAKFDSNGNCRFDGEGQEMPEIKGFWTDENDVDHQNTFFYMLFYMEQDAAGYKLLSRITSGLSNLKSLKTTTFGKVTNFNGEFHEFFDYDVEKDYLDKINIPYVNVTMMV